MVALAVTLFAIPSLAWSPPASPAPASWISDTSGVLSTDAHARLDAKLKVINQSSANEVAALLVQTLDGQDISDVTNATFKSWGVGKKGLDNGVLVVLAIKDRKMRIETGKGVEGDLPDLKTQDIQNNVMRPRLKAGDVEGALGAGFDAIATSIANHRADVAAGRTGSSSRQGPSCQVSSVGSDSSGGWILLLVAGGTIALVWYVARRVKQRREQEEAERLASMERQAARRRQVEEREAQRRRDAERNRQAALNTPTPVVQVPTVPRSNPPPRHSTPAPRPHPVTTVAVPVAASIAAAAAEEESRRHAAEAARRRRESEEADARRARERADEDRRRRDREDEDRRRRDSESSSSSSSSSSYDWGGSSSGSDSGGFGGGDSGGGGSSGDW